MTVNWNGDAVLRAISAAIEDAEQDGANLLLDASEDLVPVDTGELRESGEAVGGRVVYDAPHASVVHERMDVRHPDGQAKYVEVAAARNKRRIAGVMADRLRQAIR